MITVIKETKPVARKQHTCHACYFLRDAGFDRGTFTFSELRSIVQARQNGWSIQPGQRYINQFNSDGSDKWTYKAIPEIHDICVRHKMYEDLY